MIGTYYYPEQWPEKDWERDFRRIKEMGMRHVHMAEFAWIHMEPEEGHYEFGWLDRAVEIAVKNDLDVILCTPTATIPIWLTSQYPDALMVKSNGRRVEHGSRAHRCVNSPTFNLFAERISRIISERYGSHERVVGWQIDNELGHYTDAPCYCRHCQNKFKQYLREIYNYDIKELNRVWAGDFWSQNYQKFGQVPLPNQQTLPYFPNEHALLEFRRFFSISLARFIERQAALLRRYIRSEAWITHNFMTDDTYLYPRHVTKGLDLYTLTNYPVAGVYKGKIGTELHRIGDPIAVSFNQDFTRCHRGHWGVMEQQPGQVNWGPYNCRPYPGAVRLWLWSAIAHGAEFLDTYRYRQPQGGAEQYHEGLTGLDGYTLSQGGKEFSQVASELTQLEGLWNPLKSPKMRKAAIIYDWTSMTMIGMHTQSKDFDPIICWRRFYRVLKNLGFQVDIIRKYRTTDLSAYEVVCAALTDLVDDETIPFWKDYLDQGGHMVFSPRVATRDLNGHFPQVLYGSRLASLVNSEFLGYDVMPEGHQGKIELTQAGKVIPWNTWAEQWQPNEQSTILATHVNQFYEGTCAAFRTVVGTGTATVIGFDAANGVEPLMRDSLKVVLPNLQELPENCLYQTRGSLGIFLNYNDQPVDVPGKILNGQELLIGHKTVGPADVAVWKLKDD